MVPHSKHPAEPHVIFAGAATPGHVFPAIAIAEELMRRMPRVAITFSGTGDARQRQWVAQAGYRYVATPCHPLPRRGRGLIRFAFDNVVGYRMAESYLARHPASVVVGLGGYASVPMALAARNRRVPLVLLEQNAVAGIANRWLGPGATLVCGAFESARRYFRGTQYVITGNPVRRQIIHTVGLADDAQRRTLLVLGGSEGVEEFDRAVPEALARTGRLPTGWHIVHQATAQHLDSVRRRYAEANLPATVEPFFHDLPERLAHTALAISRAGGTTLAELDVAGVPALLCPDPQASDRYQHRNALIYERAGAAQVIDLANNGDPTGLLTACLANLLPKAVARRRMAAAMRQLARPEAAADVAKRLMALCGAVPHYKQAA